MLATRRELRYERGMRRGKCAILAWTWALVGCGGKNAPGSEPARSVAALPAVAVGDAGAAETSTSTIATTKTSTIEGASCRLPCGGKLTSELSKVARNNTLEARRCYNHALAKDPSLAGSATIRLTLDESGAVCGAAIVSHTFPDEAVPDCVRLRLAASRFPAPEGGCIELDVPINFVRP
jgi:hypothetical protein